MTSTRFFVPGTPAPQGSKRALGPGRMIEMSKNVGPWRERIAIAAHNAHHNQPLIDAPTAIWIEFVLPRRQSDKPNRPTPPATQIPDLDKLTRAVFDAITKIVIANDAQIVELYTVKRRAEPDETPGAYIEITDVTAAADVAASYAVKVKARP